MQLAQINIAKAIAPLDSPAMAGFTGRIDEINQLAEAHDGFVWRLKDDSGAALSISVFDDPSIVINMSVWRDLECFKQFVFYSPHLELLKGKRDWFTPMQQAHFAMWWVEDGTIPSIEEAKLKLKRLTALGASAEAFDFRSPHGPDGQPVSR